METFDIQSTIAETPFDTSIENEIQPAACASCESAALTQKNSPAAANPLIAAKPPAPKHFYGIGRLEFKFCSLAYEKEFATAKAGIDVRGKTEQEVFCEVIARPENRYIARRLGIVMTISDMPHYFIIPQFVEDHDSIVKLCSHLKDPDFRIVMIGNIRGIASPDMCNGLQLQMAQVEQFYSFDINSFIHSIPKPEQATEKFTAIAREIFDRMTDGNVGTSDKDIPLIFLAMRYFGIYHLAFDLYEKGMGLYSIEGVPSNLSLTRKMVNVKFTFQDQKQEFRKERYGIVVDIQESLPFVVTPFKRLYEN